MGNCGTKPETKEGEAPAPEEMVVESREVVAGEEKVINNEPKVDILDESAQPPSLAQLINEVEGEAVKEAIPTPSEEAKETTLGDEIKEVVTPLPSTDEVSQTTQIVEAVVVEEKKTNEDEDKK